MIIFLFLIIIIIVGALFIYFIGIKYPLYIAEKMEKREEEKRRKKRGW